MRQPFPGPGLTVRILGEVTPERVKTLQLADWIPRKERRCAPVRPEIWHSFTAALPVRTAGVMGDHRTYDARRQSGHAVRAGASRDGMTSAWYPVSHDVLQVVSSRTINEVKGVNRVVYDISSKPPATIEWE